MTELLNILSIDGGGMRGLIPALLLAEVERRTAQPCCELFHLMAGTSGGALVALGLASPLPTGQPRAAGSVADFLVAEGPCIFRRPIDHRLGALFGMTQAKYPARGLRRAVDALFGDVPLGEARCEVLIPCYDLSTHEPFFFSRHRARRHDDDNVPARVAARASFSAPAFFPPVRLRRTVPPGKHLLVDAGLFLNTPVLSAVLEALQRFPHARDTLILSVGTGRLALTVTREGRGGWGIEQWDVPLQGLVFDGQSDIMDTYLQAFLAARGPDERHRYTRLQPWITPEEYAMDDAGTSHLAALARAAERFIETNDALLDTLCADLVARTGNR